MSMTIRNLTLTGDWTFGSGRQNYLRDDRAIALNIKTRLKSFLNDTFWNMNFGIDWWTLLGAKNPTAEEQITIQTRAVVSASYGVVKVNSVTVSTERRSRQVTVTYNIDTIFTRNLVASIQQ